MNRFANRLRAIALAAILLPAIALGAIGTAPVQDAAANVTNCTFYGSMNQTDSRGWVSGWGKAVCGTTEWRNLGVFIYTIDSAGNAQYKAYAGYSATTSLFVATPGCWAQFSGPYRYQLFISIRDGAGHINSIWSPIYWRAGGC